MNETFLEKNFHEKMKMEKRGQETLRKSFNKRGQVTMFIILGILIVIIAGALLFVNRDNITISGLKGIQTNPIRDYIEDCAEGVVEDSLVLLKQNAGHYTIQGNPNIYGVSYISSSTYYSNDILERQISDDVKLKLETDCSLGVFGEQFDLQLGEINVDTEISLHGVSVIINWPITVTKGADSLIIDNFFVGKDDEFGIMNTVAGKIVNDEIYGGGFDVANWKENSIFKEEEIEIDRENVPEGIVFTIITPYDAGRYRFILER